MPRKAKRASKPIEHEDSQDISESQKKHYQRMGYKPYMSHSGKIKWLSFEQHAYEMIKYNNRKKVFSFTKKRNEGPKVIRSYRIWLKNIIENWLLIILLLLILFILTNMKSILSYVSTLNI